MLNFMDFFKGCCRGTNVVANNRQRVSFLNKVGSAYRYAVATDQKEQADMLIKSEREELGI